MEKIAERCAGMKYSKIKKDQRVKVDGEINDSLVILNMIQGDGNKVEVQEKFDIDKALVILAKRFLKERLVVVEGEFGNYYEIEEDICLYKDFQHKCNNAVCIAMLSLTERKVSRASKLLGITRNQIYLNIPKKHREYDKNRFKPKQIKEK